MLFLEETAAALLALGAATQESSGPDYPLGPLRLPPVTEAAEPLRLVDLSYRFSDDGRTLSAFETRWRLGASAFVGGEVTNDRLGLFLDTQRLELGLTKDDDDYVLESGFRAPWFLVRGRVERRDGLENPWRLDTEGSLRIGPDVELLLSYREDFDDRRAERPSLEEFIQSSALPPPAAETRDLRAGSVGILYQRGNHLELLSDVERATIRTEGSFDLERDRFRFSSLWNPDTLKLEGTLVYQRRSGRISEKTFAVGVGGDVELGPHWLAHARTVQSWEPGVLRFEEEYRAGLTFFGRRHRFERGSEAAEELYDLQRRVHALGYNERRVYDLEGLRALRERLGISGAREELAAAVDELYRTQVRERNVAQWGLEVIRRDDRFRGVRARVYRAFVGIPWRLRWPWSTSEGVVDFLRVDFARREESFSGGVRSLSNEMELSLSLNREMAIRLRWEDRGRTPEETARLAGRPSRFTIAYDYALGR